MKRFIKVFSRMIFSRAMVIIIMVLLQAAFLVGGFVFLGKMFPELVIVQYLVGGIIVIRITNQDEPAEFKLTWAVCICLLPILGILLYAFNASNWGMIALRRKVNKELESTKHLVRTSEGTIAALKEQPKALQKFAYYMDEVNGYPIYHNTKVTYFPIGEEKLRDLIEELKTAEEYIFMEYFIIGEGKIWDEILGILKEKVKQGVEVKVMYDGLCSLTTLPYKYPQKLQSMGIEAKMFAPVIPFLSTVQNNRDHRKIVVIDGRVAYTGGVNLSDEYANLVEVYGHWKDVGIKLEGRAVLSFTRLFIQNWNLYGKVEVDYEKYLKENPKRIHIEHAGFVIPYGDAPTAKYAIGKAVYEEMFVHSCDYIHILSPYFIVDREFLETIRYASLRGVDVKLVLPHIPDKKIPFMIARSFYPDLLSSGVRVYEYTPGFVHAKALVSDDKCATVGSVNLDYRSFYHHFECGVYMNGNQAVIEVEKDFQETLKLCKEVTLSDYKSRSAIARAFGRSLRLFAPLM